MTTPDDAACTIPPEIYGIAFGWDPQPEVHRMLMLAREFGCDPASALELGCGTGRLLAALEPHVSRLAGIELSADMAALASARTRAGIHIGDMTEFALGAGFDLIYSSANTIRHICKAEAIQRMWTCVRAHLTPNGVFIADLELGRTHIRSSVGRPAHWSNSRGAAVVDATWTVVSDTDPTTSCCVIEWTFERWHGDARQSWRQSFPLRVFDAGEFTELAGVAELATCGLFEIRDPFLLPRSAEDAQGRFLVVLGPRQKEEPDE